MLYKNRMCHSCQHFVTQVHNIFQTACWINRWDVSALCDIIKCRLPIVEENSVTCLLGGELTDSSLKPLSSNSGKEKLFAFPLQWNPAVSLRTVTHAVTLLLLTFPLLLYLLPISPSLGRFPGRPTPADSLSALSISGTSSADLLLSICCIGPHQTPPPHSPLPHHHHHQSAAVFKSRCLAFKGETRVRAHLAVFFVVEEAAEYIYIYIYIKLQRKVDSFCSFNVN